MSVETLFEVGSPAGHSQIHGTYEHLNNLADLQVFVHNIALLGMPQQVNGMEPNACDVGYPGSIS